MSYRQHRREAQSRVAGRLLEASEPEAAQQKPLLRPAEQPLHAPPSPERARQGVAKFLELTFSCIHMRI